METIRTTNRIHPLMAAAAVSVILVSLAGTAAITGILPSSNSQPAPQLQPQAMGAYGAQPSGYPVAQGAAPAAAAGPAMLAAAPMMAPANVAYAQPLQPMQQVQPVAVQPLQAQPVQPVQVVQQPAPAKKVVQAKPVHHHHYHTTKVVRNDEPPRYYPQPAPAAQPQPNYVGIGTGALIGGLIGNQIGGGNGKKLATVAGVIGGGMIGNEIANRNR